MRQSINKRKTIGIPEALSYHYFYPAWRTFFTQLGFDIKTSGITDRRKLNTGIKMAPSEACLPLKCYLGHALDLVDKVDWIFVPRLVCLRKKPRIKLGCPKFLGLPDMIRALIPEANVLSVNIDLRIEDEITSYIKMARKLGCHASDIKRAYKKAVSALEQHKKERIERHSAAPHNNKIKIGLLSHAYLLNDNYLNIDLAKRITDLECQPISCHDLAIEGMYQELDRMKSVTWYFEEDIIHAAKYFLHSGKVSGIVYLISFGCGAGSITSEIVELEIRKSSSVPILRIIIDEHTGEAGFMTRLESFVDMIKLKKEKFV